MAGRVGRAAGARGGAGGAGAGGRPGADGGLPAAGRGRRRGRALPAHRPVHDRRGRDLRGDGLPAGPGVRLRRHQPVRPRRGPARPGPGLPPRPLPAAPRGACDGHPADPCRRPVREPGHRGTGGRAGPAPGGQRPPAGRRPVPPPRRAGGRRARPPGRHRVVHAGDGPAGGAPRRPVARRRPRDPGPGRPRRRPRLLERLRRGGPRPRGGAAGRRLEQLIRQLFLSAQDGRTDARGRPRPLHAAVLAQEFADTIRFTSPPRLVQRALFGLLAPVARATGHRALDPGTSGASCPWSTSSPSRPRSPPPSPASPANRPGARHELPGSPRPAGDPVDLHRRAQRGQGRRVLPRRRRAGVPPVGRAVRGQGQLHRLAPAVPGPARLRAARAPGRRRPLGRRDRAALRRRRAAQRGQDPPVPRGQDPAGDALLRRPVPGPGLAQALCRGGRPRAAPRRPPRPHRRRATDPAPIRGGPGCGRRRSGCGPRGGRCRCPRPARRRRPG